jgi:hypothetical protein
MCRCEGVRAGAEVRVRGGGVGAVLCCATTRVGVRVLVRVRVTVGAQIESLQLAAARRLGIGVEGRGGSPAERCWRAAFAQR